MDDKGEVNSLKPANLPVKIPYWKVVLYIPKFLYCFSYPWEIHIIDWQTASEKASLLCLKSNHYFPMAFCIAKLLFSLWTLVTKLYIPPFLPLSTPFVEIATCIKKKTRRWLPGSHSSFSLNYVIECLLFSHLSCLNTNKIECKYATKEYIIFKNYQIRSSLLHIDCI